MSPPGPDRQNVCPSTRVTVLSARDNADGDGPAKVQGVLIGADRTGTARCLHTGRRGTDQRPWLAETNRLTV